MLENIGCVGVTGFIGGLFKSRWRVCRFGHHLSDYRLLGKDSDDTVCLFVCLFVCLYCQPNGQEVGQLFDYLFKLETGIKRPSDVPFYLL